MFTFRVLLPALPTLSMLVRVQFPDCSLLPFFQTVEKTDDQKAQADALSVIFTLAKENVSYAKELDGLLANKMILKVLLTPNCVTGYHFAKVLYHSYKYVVYFDGCFIRPADTGRTVATMIVEIWLKIG